jgi:hypothetical protein
MVKKAKFKGTLTFTPKRSRSSRKADGDVRSGEPGSQARRREPIVRGKDQSRYGDLMDFKEGEIPPPSSDRLQYNLSRDKK